MLELADRTLIVIILYSIQPQGRLNMLYKDMEDILKNIQTELLEMKTKICEMENILNGNNNRLGIATENTSEPEDIATETVPK